MKIIYKNAIICTLTIVQLFFTYTVVAVKTVANPIEKANITLIEEVNPELIKNTDRKLSWKEKIVSKIVERKLKKALKKQAKSDELPKRNGSSLLAVILGPLASLAYIGALLIGSYGLYIFALILGGLALLLGIIGLVQSIINSDKYTGKYSGRGLAIFGIILGIAFFMLLSGLSY